MHSAEVKTVGPAAQPLPLEVTDITKVFRTRRRGPLARLGRRKPGKQHNRAALDSVSFKVPHGEIYGILGANGWENGRHPHPVHAALAGPGTGTGLRSRRRQGARRSAAIAQSLSADPFFFKPLSALENLLFFGRAYGMDGATYGARAKPFSSVSAWTTNICASPCCASQEVSDRRWP